MSMGGGHRARPYPQGGTQMLAWFKQSPESVILPRKDEKGKQ